MQQTADVLPEVPAAAAAPAPSSAPGTSCVSHNRTSTSWLLRLVWFRWCDSTNDDTVTRAHQAALNILNGHAQWAHSVAIGCEQCVQFAYTLHSTSSLHVLVASATIRGTYPHAPVHILESWTRHRAVRTHAGTGWYDGRPVSGPRAHPCMGMRPKTTTSRVWPHLHDRMRMHGKAWTGVNMCEWCTCTPQNTVKTQQMRRTEFSDAAPKPARCACMSLKPRAGNSPQTPAHMIAHTRTC
jgi:hypothetical protein